jgi:hypothetical protein
MLSPYTLNSRTASFLTTGSQNATQTISGSLTILENLTILGSSSITFISSSTLNIGTNLITVNTINPTDRYGGLAVIDSGSTPLISASFLYDSLQDEFIFVHKGTAAGAITSSHFLLGPETYDSLGNEIYLTANRIPKGKGNEHLNDSNITDNGSVVSINSNTQITGSLSQGLEGNIASGPGSHAEGNATSASGEYSHAEGDNTQAIGNYSHAEGQETMTLASGQYSHAEGYRTIASAKWQHVQGQWNVTSSVEAAFIVGNGTDDGNRSNLIYAHDSTVEITGSLEVNGGITGSLFGTATTASYITPTFISASAAASGFGSGGTTINTSSFATTGSNRFIGNQSISGSLLMTGSIVQGNLSVASPRSIAWGPGVSASGESSIAMGSFTKAIGGYSHAEGYFAEAIGGYSHAEGAAVVSGDYSHGEGGGTVQTGATYAHAEGNGIVTTGANYSHAEGTSTTQGLYSHAEGQSTYAIGNFAHSEGVESNAIGLGSHAEGGSEYLLYQKIGIANLIEITINGSTHTVQYVESDTVKTQIAVEGDAETPFASSLPNLILTNLSLNDGSNNFEINFNYYNSINLASASYDNNAPGTTILRFQPPLQDFYYNAISQPTKASGSYTHAEGAATETIGNYSHAEGLGTIALGKYQSVTGQYNQTSSCQSAFIIGNGTSYYERTNLLYASGSEVQITGSLIVSGSSTFTNIGPAVFSGSVISTQGFTGSFSGSVVGYVPNTVTGSFITNQQTSSFVTNQQTGSFITNQQTSSFITNQQTSSFITNQQTSSFITNQQTSSFITNQQTGSFITNLQTSSMTVGTASYYNETDPIYTAEKGKYLTTGSVNTTQTISGSLIIEQNLTILGSQSIQYITSSQLNIASNLITVNTATPAIRFGGLAVVDSGSLGTGLTGSILWDSEHNVWIYTNPSGGLYDGSMFLVGPKTTTMGNEVGINKGYLAVGDGSHHMTSSQIYNSESIVRIETNTQITGRLNVLSGITGSFSGSVIGYVRNEATTSFITNLQTGSMSVATASYINPTFISASAVASGFGSGGGGGVTSITAGDGISVNQSTGSVIITNTGGSGGISQGKVVAIVTGMANLF